MRSQRSTLAEDSPSRHARLVPWKRSFSFPRLSLALRVVWTWSLQCIIDRGTWWEEEVKYVPITEIRLEHRFWPENLEDISDVGSCFLAMAPSLNKELFHYICNISRPLCWRQDDHAPSANLGLSLSSRTSRFRRPFEVFTGLSRENSSGGTSFTHSSLREEAMIRLN